MADRGQLLQDFNTKLEAHTALVKEVDDAYVAAHTAHVDADNLNTGSLVPLEEELDGIVKALAAEKVTVGYTPRPKG